MRILSAAAAATLAGGAIGFFSQGNFSVMIISWLLLVGTVPLLAVFAGWAALSFKRTGEVHRVARVQLIVFGMIAWTLLISTVAGNAMGKHNVSQAMKFPEETREAFEEYRMEHGRYPNTLEDLPEIQIPRLLRDEHRYKADQNHFTLNFIQPSGFFGLCEYDSNTGYWTFD